MKNRIVKTRARVFGSLRPGEIIIHIAYGYGMNDGGSLRIFNRSDVPKDCRLPNTYLWLTMNGGNVLKIERMNEYDIERNKM